MADILIEGVSYRAYFQGNVYVSPDGEHVREYKWVDKHPTPGDEIPIHTRRATGQKYVEIKKFNQKLEVSVAEAVGYCYCYRPNDGKKYELQFKDGDPKNCHKKNLKWVAKS